jgi:excisionase family DNA binding protein
MNKIDQSNFFEEYFFTIYEFAKLMKVSHQTIRRAVKDGRINAVRIPGKKSITRIPKSEMQRLGMFNLREVIKKIISEENLK